jgi:predicted enzyme related to lactoylglutathione lyase
MREKILRGTDFVLFQVSDLAAAARFYRESLGLPQEVYSEEGQWAEFNCGNVTLSLHGGFKLPDGTAGGRIALAVEDIHAAYDELKKKGVPTLSEPRDYEVCWAMEVLDPQVQLCGDGAVLTYNFFGESEGRTDRWNCTEVYRRTSAGWRILHTHWSFTRPFAKP